MNEEKIKNKKLENTIEQLKQEKNNSIQKYEQEIKKYKNTTETLNNNVQKYDLEIKKNKNTIETLNSNIQKYEQEIKKYKNNTETLNKNVQKYEQEIKKNKNTIETLNNNIQKLSAENNNLKEENKKLKNNPQNNSNNSEENLKLYKRIAELTEKIDDLNEKINRYPFILEKGEKMLSVMFISVDQHVNYSMICKNTDTINKLEADLYKEYPNLSETENYFMCKGSVLNKFQQFKELNFKNGDVIVVNQRED